MNRGTPGLPVHYQLLDFTQIHVHRVSDAIQPSHPLASPSPPAPNPSQHQSLFQWVNSSHEVAKVREFQLQHHSLQRNTRADLLQNGGIVIADLFDNRYVWFLEGRCFVKGNIQYNGVSCPLSSCPFGSRSLKWNAHSLWHRLSPATLSSFFFDWTGLLSPPPLQFGVALGLVDAEWK